MKRSRAVSTQNSKGVEFLFKKNKITWIKGTAKLTGKNAVSVKTDGKEEKHDAKKDVKSDIVLVAAGRAPNIEDIGLKELGVKLTDRGFVQIDKRMATSVANVYAIGDVAGPPMLAHKGEREGIIVAEVLAGHQTHALDYTNVPGATYCHPEVASVGLTEQQCKDKKIEYKVGKFPFSANGRARTPGETEGFVKIIRGAKYGEILGAHIVGAQATELIHELVVARTNEYTVEEVDLAIHAHPTLSAAVAEASLDSLGKMIHA